MVTAHAKRRLPGALPLWLVAALMVSAVLGSVQLLSGYKSAELSGDHVSKNWLRRTLATAKPLDYRRMRSSHKCHEAEDGQPEQRVCVFENLVLHNGAVVYLTDDLPLTLPPVKISWLRKFEGDDFFHPDVRNASDPGIDWAAAGAAVEEVPLAGLFHQHHYSNFYHMFSEVAPSIHHVLCKYLSLCAYDPASAARVIFIQEKRPDLPGYTMLDSITDTFRCLTPHPVQHKDDAALRGKVLVLRRAVVGVSPEVRVFHNWEDDLRENWREPPKPAMLLWRQRVADCFGFNFTQEVASTAPLRILFINRHYEEGRMILNAAKIAHKIRTMPEVAGFPSVELTVKYLEGEESIREQAALFWNASLLIWPHGATMAHTLFLPRGAQAIEVVPWVQQDKANLPEWVQAIRDAFSLGITLYDVQNKERRRAMFNTDKLLEYEEYRRMTPDQKIALLERGECPEGIDGFLCPFWWNHWKVSVNLDWETLQPFIRAALQRLKAGPDAPAAEPAAAKAKQPAPKRKPAKRPKSGADDHNRSLSEQPPLPKEQQQQQRVGGSVVLAGSGSKAGAAPDMAALLAGDSRASAGGVPLSSYTCLHDDGSPQHRLCVFHNILIYHGRLYYVAEDPSAAALPEIQVAWEDWTLQKGLREDKYFLPRVVSPDQLPFSWVSTKVERVARAGLVHRVDSGNFYHLLSEVMPTYFANWCALLGYCSQAQRKGFDLIFIQPDPKRVFAVVPPLKDGFQCFSDAKPRDARDEAGAPVLVAAGVVGIGPYLRAYEKQEFRAQWDDPAPGLMPQWRRFLSECTGTGFVDARVPSDVIRITFVNRPYSSGRMFLNLPETVTWLEHEWLPAQSLGRPVEVVTARLYEEQSLAEQIEVFRNTSVLVYPHGATMAHAVFLPRGAVAVEVIPWPNVTEPHGWLQSIKHQYELEEVELLLMVNKYRDHLVLNWHALAQDPVWRALPAEAKVALQETGACPADQEPKCFFDWLHWRTELVLNRGQLSGVLAQALAALRRGPATRPDPGDTA